MKSSFTRGFLALSLLSFSLHAAKPATEIIGRPSTPPAVTTSAAAPINLNTADAKALSKSVKGIGIKRAESIVKYREEHGAFKSVNELSEVPLIGKNFVSKHLTEIERIFVIN